MDKLRQISQSGSWQRGSEDLWRRRRRRLEFLELDRRTEWISGSVDAVFGGFGDEYTGVLALERKSKVSTLLMLHEMVVDGIRKCWSYWENAEILNCQKLLTDERSKTGMKSRAKDSSPQKHKQIFRLSVDVSMEPAVLSTLLFEWQWRNVEAKSNNLNTLQCLQSI